MGDELKAKYFTEQPDRVFFKSSMYYEKDMGNGEFQYKNQVH